MKELLFTSEAVSEGHPDKLADQIADKILDAHIKVDPKSHVACEVFLTTEYVLVGGEITSKAKVNIEKIVRDTLKEIGYLKPEIGIGYKTCIIENKIQKQSEEIANAVDKKSIEEQGAGDQGIVYGYATNETKTFMPLPFVIATEIVAYASKLRKENKFPWARPDMKSQVTYDYKNNRIHTILISIQHDANYLQDKFENFIVNKIIKFVIKKYHLNDDCKIIVNPSKSFVVGGPHGDTGLTGRKIICDTYGGAGHHGGGAFSGKDGSKVDRSGAYYARYIAKNLVASNVADKIEIQISYGIGLSKPINVSFDTFDTNHVKLEIIDNIIHKFFVFNPGLICEKLQLLNPPFKYFDTSCYGHFGKEKLNFTWEKLDKVSQIKKFLANNK